METITITQRASVGLIKSDEELHAALEEIDVLMDLGQERRPDQDERYDLLALVVEHYEQHHSTVEQPDAVEMIEFAMERLELRQRDLIPYLGSKSRASEILNRKRKLTLKMMRKLHEGLGIPLEILVRDYELENGVRSN